MLPAGPCAVAPAPAVRCTGMSSTARLIQTIASTTSASSDEAANAWRQPASCAMVTTNTGASAQPRLPEMPCAA